MENHASIRDESSLAYIDPGSIQSAYCSIIRDEILAWTTSLFKLSFSGNGDRFGGPLESEE